MNPDISDLLVWFLTVTPAFLILWMHFRNQDRTEYFCHASNYWVIFYVVGYFFPIPLFIAGEDGWSMAWGYSFVNFQESLVRAVVLATIGGVVLSMMAAPRSRRRNAATSAPGLEPPTLAGVRVYDFYEVRWIRIALVLGISLGCLYIGIQVVGGLATLLANLGDRITLFAGVNAFFLPVNLLIGVCFALSAARAVGSRIPRYSQWVIVAVTLPALFLLGQKSNIFILVVGIAIIKIIENRGIGFRWVAVSVIALPNFLMLYEFIFRDALINGFDTERLTLNGWMKYLLIQITTNFMQIQNLTVLVDSVPELHPYLLGDTYFGFFQLLIPQSFIGVKPLTGAGAHTLVFWPDVVARESTTMPPGLFGEAYFNFGVVGYLTLCFLVGLVLRYVDKSHRRTVRTNVMGIVAIATFGSMSLHFIRGEYFSPLLIFLGIFLGARAVVKKIRRPLEIC